MESDPDSKRGARYQKMAPLLYSIKRGQIPASNSNGKNISVGRNSKGAER